MWLSKGLPILSWVFFGFAIIGCRHAGPEGPASGPQAAAPVTAVPSQPGASSVAPAPDEQATPAAAPASASQALPFPQASSAFGLELYQKLGSSLQGNLAVSPVSISTALAMTWAGARGETQQQMTRALHLLGTANEVAVAASDLTASLNALNDKATTLSVQSALFVDQTCKLERAFVEVASKQFKVPAQPVDFLNAAAAIRKTINSQVAKQTNERIPEILPENSLGATTKAVVTNAVYFVGNWLSPFSRKHTRPGDFYVNGQTAQKVPMMDRKATFPYAAFEGVQILEMPYKGKGKDLSMLIVLPDERNGLRKIEQELATERLEGWLRSLQEKELLVQLPRFELRSTTPLKEPLEKLGMAVAFDDKKANFSGMSACGELFLDNVYHEVFVKVDEQGTEATAATAGVMQMPIRARVVQRFIADHPFLFAIRHRSSGTLLFLGRVVAPKSSLNSMETVH